MMQHYLKSKWETFILIYYLLPVNNHFTKLLLYVTVNDVFVYQKKILFFYYPWEFPNYIKKLINLYIERPTLYHRTDEFNYLTIQKGINSLNKQKCNHV
jgi:hypothetical protein